MCLTKKYSKLLPLLNRVLIKKIEPVKAQSKIILSTKDEVPNVGTVVAIGPGNISDSGVNIPLQLTTGSLVLLPEFGGQKVNLKDGEYYLYRDSEIMGILED